MQLFENAYKKALNTNKKTFSPNFLDPQVFYFPDETSDPILLPSITSQILNDIQNINQIESESNKTRIWNYVITGPILKKDSHPQSAIIIKLQINPTNLDDVIKEKILQYISQINNRLAINTQHPIIYLPTIRQIEIEKLNGAYQPFYQKWIKLPDFLEESFKKTIEHIAEIKPKKSKQTLLKGLRKLERI